MSYRHRVLYSLLGVSVSLNVFGFIFLKECKRSNRIKEQIISGHCQVLSKAVGYLEYEELESIQEAIDVQTRFICITEEL